MPVSQKIGSFAPMRFVGTGKPVRPMRPQNPNREPSRKGIRFSGKSDYKKFTSLNQSLQKPSLSDLSNSAIKIQRAGGNLNIVV